MVSKCFCTLRVEALGDLAPCRSADSARSVELQRCCDNYSVDELNNEDVTDVAWQVGLKVKQKPTYPLCVPDMNCSTLYPKKSFFSPL